MSTASTKASASSPARSRPIGEVIPEGLKVPHIGWNALALTQEGRACSLFKNTKEGDCVYFVHSYWAASPAPYVLAAAEYGAPLTAAVGRGNVLGVQFHPEKSGSVGLAILRAFSRNGGGRMKLFPRHRFKDGRVVRLVKGEFSTARQVAGDEVETARAFKAAGAQRVHMVDLDGARSGTRQNGAIVAAVAAAGLSVQLGGGIRTLADLEAVFELGVRRAG